MSKKKFTYVYQDDPARRMPRVWLTKMKNDVQKQAGFVHGWSRVLAEEVDPRLTGTAWSKKELRDLAKILERAARRVREHALQLSRP